MERQDFKDFMTNPYAWVAVLFAVIFAPVTVLVMTRVVKALGRKTFMYLMRLLSGADGRVL